ncbi:biogenesis of lysosome-related organelles complex 1 subunit 3 [Diabrotica virgifera virgifera]|uniref:Biogenesis of lysosome-related organelles complex 1 subunit 3 n=1 Tax=Diabrotica virgifera virgifera TaxID=50390 RepID=A0A6P7G8Q6_DIAVI|nr:biogenesis of lysosome-related organelles complex 1 subunit 3 [Diabrotica virgifera virgifera]
MNKSVVITGEASETDSEDEIQNNTLKAMTKTVQGAVITGEDSESDTEIDNSVASATSALNQKELLEVNESKCNSLFHQKLREYNEQLNHSFETHCQNTVHEASKNLNVIDQHLLRSQITMQNAVTSLKTLSINSLSIKSKLHSLLSSKFLTNVTLNRYK